MDWIIGIVTGVVAGVVSSIIFFIAISLIKPRIEIADKICCTTLEDGKIAYRIKVVNHSKTILTNLKYLLLYYSDDEHGVTVVKEIQPVKKTLHYIDAYKRKKNYSDYAIRIQYCFDINEFPLDDHNKLVFTFFAEHSFSNKSVCCKKVYNLADIKQGIFETGKSMNII